MVGIVVVSHSQKLAEGVVEIARMVAANAPLAAAGGLDDGGTGTSFRKIHAAIEQVYSEDGVLVAMDMGSAVMTTEMVLESMEDQKIKMLDCALVEGTVVAALESSLGTSLEEIIPKAVAAGTVKKIME